MEYEPTLLIQVKPGATPVAQRFGNLSLWRGKAMILSSSIAPSLTLLTGPRRPDMTDRRIRSGSSAA